MGEFGEEVVKAFEDSNSKALKTLVPQVPEKLAEMKDQEVVALCKHLRLVRDYPRTLNYALVRNDKIVRALCDQLQRTDRSAQIALCETISVICEHQDYPGFAGSGSCAISLEFLLHSYNEDALLPLFQSVASYHLLLQQIGVEPRLLEVISRLLRDCSFEALILAVFDCLLSILAPKSECTLRSAFEAQLIPTLLIYIGNPSAEIKRRTMVALTTFKDAPYAVEPLATQGIGNLMHALVSFPDAALRKMTIDMLTAIAQSKAEYRDSLIVHNFAPLCIGVLTGTDYSVKLEMLHLLLLVLKDRQRQHIDELVENNVITVICRIAQREDALRDKALECVEAILAAGGVDGMYKALLKECRITKLLLGLRNTESGVLATQILSQHFPKELAYNPAQAAPFLAQQNQIVFAPPVLNFPQNIAPLAPPQPMPAPVVNIPPPAVQIAPKTQKKSVNRHPKGRPSAKPQAAKPTATPPVRGKGCGKVIPFRRRSAILSGLVFPIPRVYRRLRALGHRVSRISAVFLTAALEYLTAEVLDLAGAHCKRMKLGRIQPRDLREAMRDDELAVLTRRVVLPGSDNVSRDNEGE